MLPITIILCITCYANKYIIILTLLLLLLLFQIEKCIVGVDKNKEMSILLSDTCLTISVISIILIGYLLCYLKIRLQLLCCTLIMILLWQVMKKYYHITSIKWINRFFSFDGILMK